MTVDPRRAATPLLETKFYVPRRRRGLVARPRLSERLNRVAESKLTLISAPAGFGKTTLLAEWLADAPADRPATAWLSLDPGDNQAATFWPYMVAALQKVAPGVGATALSLLESTQQPISAVLATLLNDLGAVPNDVVLVLDDYHAVDARDIQDGIAFMLDHLPPQMHLVIATRADPGLPLARLRARGELVEIRAADLRFTPDEAAAYLNGVMGLALTGRDAAALERRTEGWIAALQLAALSMQGRDDIAGFIAGFAGDDRYIVDYLAEEVLHRQPESVRRFLLQTSILDRLSGPLCDAVTGEDGGRAMLEALDRGNLFLVPLDDRRRWYRYQHLFADVLQARLLDEQPDDVADLHRRASEWYERNGERSEAIRHAMAGEDFERAADLIERTIPAMRQTRQEATARRWLEALPDEVVRRRPVLSVGYAGVLMAVGELDAAETRLREAEQWLAASDPAAEMVIADEEEFRRLPGMIALYRAGQAQGRGDDAAVRYQAQRVLDLAADDEHLLRGAASALLGLASWASGDLESAHRLFSEGMALLLRGGYITDAVGGTLALADIRIVQGRLRDAMVTYEQSLQLAREHGEPALRGTADMYVGMADLDREHGDLELAARHLQTSRELGEHIGFPQNRYRSSLAAARIRQAQGDLAGALDLLREAERDYVSDFFPNVRPVAAMAARLLVEQGRSDEALGWARAQGLSANDDLSYLREFEHVTLARVLLAQSGRDRADRSPREPLDLLGRLLRAAEEGQRTGSVIEILVLQALAHQMRGDIPAALVPLGRALTLAEPEGYVRVFVDEGPLMAALLEAVANIGTTPGYVRQLLAAFGRGVALAPIRQALVEPLSERELEVLRLLASDLDGPEIARELVVSLHTVRSHTKNIYAKLGVNNRRAAVSRAAEIGLVSRARDRS